MRKHVESSENTVKCSLCGWVKIWIVKQIFCMKYDALKLDKRVVFNVAYMCCFVNGIHDFITENS